jgi:hypothetical protein
MTYDGMKLLILIKILIWTQLLVSAILTTQETEIGRIMHPGQPRQKVRETTSQSIKIPGHDDLYLSSKLCRKLIWEDHSPGCDGA